MRFINTNRYWAEYANHMLRFYVRNDNFSRAAPFKSASDEQNWRACDQAMREIPRDDRRMIYAIYAQPASLTDAVKTYLATHEGKTIPDVWREIRNVSRRVAQLRGLV